MLHTWLKFCLKVSTFRISVMDHVCEVKFALQNGGTAIAKHCWINLQLSCKVFEKLHFIEVIFQYSGSQSIFFYVRACNFKMFVIFVNILTYKRFESKYLVEGERIIVSTTSLSNCGNRTAYVCDRQFLNCMPPYLKINNLRIIPVGIPICMLNKEWCMDKN